MQTDDHEERTDSTPTTGAADLVSPMIHMAPDAPPGRATSYHNLKTLQEVLDRDRQREEDGFPKKIKIGRLVRPARRSRDKIVVVPTTVEDRFVHDSRPVSPQDEETGGGSGDGEEGEVIGKQPIHDTEGGGMAGGDQGDDDAHGVSSNAYELGRMLTENFRLPNLKEKGKKRSLTKYVFDLTDKNRGSGQFLDKKSTLRSVVRSNVVLGRIKPGHVPSPDELIIDPRDKIYRTLSRERDYESQALVFFLRDYSASMSGKPTDIVASQHVLIYSWLLYQYEQSVETRFLLHDTQAREVESFYKYYNLSVAGGTRVASGFELINKIVEQESLVRDYNIYVFYGTDGDDMDSTGGAAIEALETMLTYANRIGVTVVAPSYRKGSSTFEEYLEKSGLPEKHPQLLRTDRIGEEDPEERMIEGIRTLVSEEAPTATAGTAG